MSDKFKMILNSGTRRTSRAHRDARYKRRKDSGHIVLYPSGIEKILKLGKSINSGTAVRLAYSKSDNRIGMMLGNPNDAFYFRKSGKQRSNGDEVLEVMSKYIHADIDLYEGLFFIEKPRSSESQFDFILAPISTVKMHEGLLI